MAALRAITSQPVLRSNGTAFNSPVVSSVAYFDADMVKPAFPGELIDIIPAASVLTNPINSTPITMDVFGNARNDANGLRDIGAFQLGLASALSLGTITDGSVGLSWTEPLHHAGIAILNYRIVYSEVGGFGDFVDVPSTNLTTTITGLTNGVEYEFSVEANYDPGNFGPASNTVSATPLGAMTAPAVTATPGNTEVALSWDVSDLGGRTFQQYNILWYEQVSGNFVDFHQVFDPNEITYTVTGLTNGTTYDFIITARASEDTSPSGTASATPDANLGINDLDLLDGKFSYYPNPVNDKLHIDIEENFTAKFFSINGALLIDVKSKKIIDISKFNTGIYILQIQVNGKLYYGKILKK